MLKRYEGPVICEGKRMNTVLYFETKWSTELHIKGGWEQCEVGVTTKGNWVFFSRMIRPYETYNKYLQDVRVFPLYRTLVAHLRPLHETEGRLLLQMGDLPEEARIHFEPRKAQPPW